MELKSSPVVKYCGDNMRGVQSFRVNHKLWNQFKNKVTQQGFSTCFIMETLIQAYLKGTDTNKKVNKSSSIVINQKIDYNVKKSRRTVSFQDNCYSKKMGGIWFLEKPDSKSDLRTNGHHISCECRACTTSNAEAQYSRSKRTSMHTSK